VVGVLAFVLSGSLAVGVTFVVGSVIFSMTVQLVVATWPRDVVPPQVQSPAHPGTASSPLLQAVPTLLNSFKPLQQARCPLPPQDDVGVTHVPAEK
jgi:hypothetical protein